MDTALTGTETIIEDEPIKTGTPGRRRRRPPGRGHAADSAPGWIEALGSRGAAQVCFLAALFGWLYWDQFVRTYTHWLEPDWSHGFVIPIFCLYVVHDKRRALLTGDHRGSLWGAVLILLSIGGYAFSILGNFGSPQFLAPVPTLAGLILLLRGWRALWMTAFPLAMMVMALPPPTHLYRAMTQPLQQLIARIAAPVLNVFPGVDEVLSWGIHIRCWLIDGTESMFTVAGACSGMRSLMAFAFFGLATAYFARRRNWQRAVIVLAIAPVAMFCNFLRVVVTGGLIMYGHDDFAMGTPHSLLGFAMFGVGITLFLALLWIVDHLFVEEDESDPSVGQECVV